MNLTEWNQNPNKVKQFFGDLVTIDVDHCYNIYLLQFDDCWCRPELLYSGQYLFDRNTNKMSIRLKANVSFEFRLITNLGI